MGKRCQVCDGPVVNGRCKLCGMPYRNDEVLYHLNESRTDHYRHATPKAQKIMKQQETPWGDKKKTLGRTSSKEEIRAHQQKVRQDAVKRMTETKTGSGENTRNTGNTRNTRNTGNTGNTGSTGSTAKYGRNAKEKSAQKNRKKASGFSILVSLLVVLFGLVPTIGEFVMEHRDSLRIGGSESAFEFLNESGTAVLEFTEEIFGNGNRAYYVGKEYGEAVVGSDLEEGTYKVSVESGSADVMVYRASEATNYSITDSKNSIVLILREGDTVFVQPGSKADRVVFYQLSY